MRSLRRTLSLSAAPLLAGLLSAMPVFAADGASSGAWTPGIDGRAARTPLPVSRELAGMANARGSSRPAFGASRDFGRALALNEAWHWRDLRSGLGRKLDGRWSAALNYTRALGAAGAAERLGSAAPRTGGSPAGPNGARRALVLTLARHF